MKSQSARLIAALLLLLPLSGCSTPAKRYASAIVTYRTLNESFNTAVRAGLLTDEQMVASAPYWKAADNQIEIVRQQFKNNGTVNETATKMLERALDDLEKWLIEQRSKP